jgi:methylglutaconyl-CoA hydratase
VATVTLDAPHKRNALSRGLSSELFDAVTELGASDAVRAIVLTHTGPVFCAGADLKERNAGVFPEVGPGALLTAVARCPKPVIARLAGAARAGGVGLAAACDLSVVADDASFAFTEVRLGLIPATIAAVVVPRMGHSRAAELFVTGRTFSADEAVEWGLFTATCGSNGLDQWIAQRLDEIGESEPVAMATTKALVRRLSGFAEDSQISELEVESQTWFESPGGIEGMTAFGEKRAPSWSRRLGEGWSSES